LVEDFRRFVNKIAGRSGNPGIIESHIEPTESGNRALARRGGRCLVRYGASNSYYSLTGGG
jgi:hypothetical protein